MAFEQKPPNQFFDPKNPPPPLDLERIFNEERINMKAILDSRKLTKEINKTLAPYTGEFGINNSMIAPCSSGMTSGNLKQYGLTQIEDILIIDFNA